MSLITRHFAAALLAATLAGCGSVATRESTAKAPPARGGGYYLDDGPGANPPANLDSIPDAVPRLEPLHRGASRPYVVMGRSYTPMTSLQPYRARGLATWYGRRYHGRQTSTGELYDMYAMTAAHTTLPLPSYARVTNLENGRSVIVRVNDRGPFIGNRLIDLSYTAAHRLGLLGAGSAMVEVESLLPGAAQQAAPAASARDPVAPAAAPAVPGETAKDVPASAATIPVALESGALYLQLGAFGSRDNAEGFHARLASSADWLALDIVARDGLYRVQSGPYGSADEARAVSQRILELLGVRPMLITR